MLWFLRDYPLATLILRALTLAFDALFIGGLFFHSILLGAPFKAPQRAQRVERAGLSGEKSSYSFSETDFFQKSQALLRISALGLATAQVGFILLDTAILSSTTGLPFTAFFTANYFLAGVVLVAAAILFLAVRRFGSPTNPLWLLFIPLLLYSTVWTSHAASRLEYRALLIVLTALHQLAVAFWIGSLPYLWLFLETQDRNKSTTAATVRRYSFVAVISVAVLVFSGVCAARFYTQSWSAVYGTGYGFVLIEKSILLAGLLLFAAGSFLLLRNRRIQPSWLLRIARFSEVEIGIGFTIILAAASLSAQPPAVDLVQNRLTLPEIAARMAPVPPRFETPPLSAMPTLPPLGRQIRQEALSPDDIQHANNRVERAWSEYNHHWAGIIVFAAGLLALLGKWKRIPWARNWPLAFLGLAVFLFFRADPESWPLGPRGFWASFYNPEDLLHRLSILLILSFVGFEWGVQTHRLRSPRAALVFPAVCAIGGALLLTHNHSLGNVKEELLTNISHAGIAICAVFAGWSRWLEVRSSAPAMSSSPAPSRPAPSCLTLAAARVWPVFLMAIGLILLNYRES